MQLLKNKTALITGAAKGIGRAITLRLAQEGMDLHLVDIDAVGLVTTAEDARQYSVAVTTAICDVSQLEDIVQCVQDGLRTYRAFDLLVNNAGVAYYGRTDLMSVDHCEYLLRVNLHAPLHFSRLLLPCLLSRPEAQILNVASFLGLVGTQKLAAYSATKFGLVGLSESLRAEYARTNVGVTVLCPGFVETELFESAPFGSDRQTPKQPPLWMLTSPEKVAARAILAIRRNEALVVMQHYARLTYLAKRLVPGLIDFANHLSRKRLVGKVESPPTADERRQAA